MSNVKEMHWGAPFSPFPISRQDQSPPRSCCSDAMVRPSQMSSISKPHLDMASTQRLGAEIRRRRLVIGLSQADLGRPFSRAYVSAVETGRCIPSLSALVLMAQRLGTTSGELLEQVNPALGRLYTRQRVTGQTQRSVRPR